MSRRDTIIIAVLVNAGLLMILFATALKSDDKKKDKQASLTQLAEAPPVARVPEEAVVKQYAMAGVPTLITEEIPFESFQIPEEKPAEPKQQTLQADVYCVNVTVKKGDFLERIAKANNATVSSIMAENKLSSTQLKVGQVLRVPVRQKPIEAVASSATPTPSAAAAEEYYIVKDGDNPWLIASKNHVSVSELLRINNLDDQKARRLRPGDRLKIR